MDSCPSSKQINRKKFNRTQTKKGHHKDHKQVKKGQKKSCGDSDSHEEFSNKLLSQLDCRFAELSDEDDTDSGKAFEDLVNAPVSTSSFVFKSEKKWTWDSSQFSDYFTVDVDHLSRIFNCIPFTEYVGVGEKYLNKDELTLINSLAEQARKDYVKELEQSLEQALEDQNCGMDNKKECINSGETVEEDLDFLLSLKEPVRVLSTTVSSVLSRVNEEPKGKTDIKSTKSIDLEKWLDSVLDD